MFGHYIQLFREIIEQLSCRHGWLLSDLLMNVCLCLDVFSAHPRLRDDDDDGL